MRRPDDDEALDYLKENGRLVGCLVTPLAESLCDHCLDDAEVLVPVNGRGTLLCEHCAERVVDECMLDASPLTRARCRFHPTGLNADWAALTWPTVIPDLYICDEEGDGLYSLWARDLNAEDYGEEIEVSSAKNILALVQALLDGIGSLDRLGKLAGMLHKDQWAAALVRAVAAREFNQPVSYPFYSKSLDAPDVTDSLLAKLFFTERTAQKEAGTYKSDEQVAMVLAWG